MKTFTAKQHVIFDWLLQRTGSRLERSLIASDEERRNAKMEAIDRGRWQQLERQYDEANPPAPIEPAKPISRARPASLPASELDALRQQLRQGLAARDAAAVLAVPGASIGSGQSATRQFHDAVAAKRAAGMSPADAVRAVNKENPGLRERMVAEANR